MKLDSDQQTVVIKNFDSTGHWTKIIRPKTRLLDLRLKELWIYRDLIMMFVKRDYITNFKQTILGPIWFFLQPLITTLTYVIIFGRIARLSTDGIPMLLFYLSGITIWNFFSETLNRTATVFKDNEYLFGKVYFPRLAMPLSIVISRFYRFLVQITFFLIIWGFYLSIDAINPNIYILITPLLIFIMGMIALGLGMIISSLTTKYKDLSFLLGFGLQLLMFATPVIYPLSTVPENYKWLILANPMSSIIETFRFAFLGSGSFSWYYLGYSLGFAFFIMFFGTVVFNKVEKSFADII